MISATSELLADRYRLEERIASGGMGVVWRARDERLCRDVAIKLIRPEYADDPTFRERLRIEARAIAAIHSAHVVRIHDVCEEHDPSGGYRAFLVMELVEGAPLSAVLREGTLALPLTIEVIRRTASALASAHDQQIIHRDIKPANLMIDAAGRVTVLDFGIARAADAVALTATDLILGTARYISPEQADGRSATSASDVYSLGVVAFQCLTGKVPFDAGSDVGVALAHLRDPVPALPAKVPAPLARLVTSMLAKSPDERPTATTVAEELARMSADADTSGVTVPIPRIRLDVERAATALMPLVMAAHHRVRDRLAGRDLRETRSAPLRPRMLLIPAVMALLLALGLAIGGGSSGLQPSAAAGTASHSPLTHAAASYVTVDPSRYRGRRWTDVRAELIALGLHPTPQYAATGAVGTVVALAPTGQVEKGTSVTVVVARAPATKHVNPPKPAAKPKPNHGPGHEPPGQAKKHGDDG